MMENKKSLGFIFGILFGVSLTLLFTTKKGQRIKDKIVKSCGEIFDEISENIQEFEKEEFQDVETVKSDQDLAIPLDHIKTLQEKGRKFFIRRNKTN